MSIVYTQQDLDALKEALLTGADEVVIGDRKIRYRSQAHLLALIKIIQEQLQSTAQSSTQPALVKASYKKGLAE